MSGHDEQITSEMLAQVLLNKIRGDVSKGFPTRQEAVDAAIAAGIPNPGIVVDNNEFFFTDPSAAVPEGTWATASEAEQFARSIQRADLAAVFDSATGRFRLEDPPQSTPTGTVWIPEIGKYEVTLADGRVQLVDPAPASEATAAAPFGSTVIPGTDFMLVNDGQGGTSIVAKSQAELQAGQPQGEIVTLDGRQFIQQPGGSLVPLGTEPVPSMEDLIVRALLDDDIAGAIALDNFQNRPNSMEFFQAALDFAQSPGDIAAISAIARGQTLVEPGPPGSVQRIAEQPQILQDAFQQLTQLFSGGDGSPNDIVSALTRASQRMTEDNQIAADAQQALADRDAADAEKELQNLLDRIDVLENPVSQVGLPPAPVGLPPAPFVSEENQQILDNPSVLTPPPTTAPFASEENQEIISNPGTVNDALLGLSIAEDDLFAGGGVFDDNTAIVGENGPELLIARPGARVIPLGKGAAAKLKKRLGVRGLQEGGFVPAPVGQSVNELIWAAAIAATPEEDRPFDPFNVFIPPELRVGETLPQPVPINAPQQAAAQQIAAEQGATLSPLPDATVSDPTELPFGVQQALKGGSIEPTRRRLSTAAGIPVLSAQAQQRLLPEELDVLDRLRAEAGIPLGAFQQEQRSALPGGLRARASRLSARVVR